MKRTEAHERDRARCRAVLASYQQYKFDVNVLLDECTEESMSLAAERDELRNQVEFEASVSTAMRTDHDELAARLEAAREVLRIVEWSCPLMHGRGMGCPVCHQNEGEGHRSIKDGFVTGCKLAAALRGGAGARE